MNVCARPAADEDAHEACSPTALPQCRGAPPDGQGAGGLLPPAPGVQGCQPWYSFDLKEMPFTTSGTSAILRILAQASLYSGRISALTPAFTMLP